MASSQFSFSSCSGYARPVGVFLVFFILSICHPTYRVQAQVLSRESNTLIPSVPLASVTPTRPSVSLTLPPDTLTRLPPSPTQLAPPSAPAAPQSSSTIPRATPSRVSVQQLPVSTSAAPTPTTIRITKGYALQQMQPIIHPAIIAAPIFVGICVIGIAISILMTRQHARKPRPLWYTDPNGHNTWRKRISLPFYPTHDKESEVMHSTLERVRLASPTDSMERGRNIAPWEKRKSRTSMLVAAVSSKGVYLAGDQNQRFVKPPTPPTFPPPSFDPVTPQLYPHGGNPNQNQFPNMNQNRPRPQQQPPPLHRAPSLRTNPPPPHLANGALRRAQTAAAPTSRPTPPAQPPQAALPSRPKRTNTTPARIHNEDIMRHHKEMRALVRQRSLREAERQISIRTGQ